MLAEPRVLIEGHFPWSPGSGLATLEEGGIEGAAYTIKLVDR